MLRRSDKREVLTLETNTADRAAAGNWDANLSALRSRQPSIAALLPAMPDRDWALARDGSLSCRIDGEWVAGCSVPADAAAIQFDKPRHGKPVLCVPDPLTAHHLAAAVATLGPGEAIVARFGDTDAAATALCMADFAADLIDERLWLTIGEDWLAQLDAMYDQHPGLPVIGEFMRQPHHNDRYYEDLVTDITPVVRRIAERTAETIEQRHGAAMSGEWLLIAGSHWRPQDDAGHVLATSLGGDRVDPDRPTQAAQSAVRLATPGATAIVAANLYRCNVPNAASAEQPWVTWQTHGTIRPRAAAGPNDKLLVADPADLDAARDAGWEDVAVAGWPSLGLPVPASNRIVLLADIPTIDELPDQVERVSGQRPLWEAVAQLLDAAPLAYGGDPRSFVRGLAGRLKITRYDEALLIDRWVMPRVLRGMLATLRGAGLTVRHAVPESRDEWRREATDAAVLIDPSPMPRTNQLRAAGRGILTCRHANATELITAAQSLLHGRPPEIIGPTLSVEVVRNVIDCR